MKGGFRFLRGVSIAFTILGSLEFIFTVYCLRMGWAMTGGIVKYFVASGIFFAAGIWGIIYSKRLKDRQ